MLMPDTYTGLYSATKLLKDYDLVVNVWQTEEPWRFGVVDLKDQQIMSVYDKPLIKGTSWFWGEVKFNNNLWSYLETETETFSHTLDRAIQDGMVAIANKCNTWYLDIGTPKSYIDAIKRIN
jgi:dTDP-glucose pyrophosphorylase